MNTPDESTDAGIDILVAEKVMGWRPKEFNPINLWLDSSGILTGWSDSEWPSEEHNSDAFHLFGGNGTWSPSTDIKAAFQVVEKIITGTVWECYLTHQFDGWDCLFAAPDKADAYGVGESAPLAICLAALKLCGLSPTAPVAPLEEVMKASKKT